MHREQYGGSRARARSPLIGRSAQLLQLDELFECASNGEGAAALLWGEAGIGKTRLLDEFAARAFAAGAKIGKTSCFQFLCPPFAPLRDLFAAVDVAEPFTAGAAALSTEAGRYRAFLAATQTLRSAATSPILLVVDDLQWADFATIEFLTFLVPRLSDAGVVVLGAVRCDALESDHRRTEALDRLTRQGARPIVVPPLEHAEIRQLVASIWPAVTTEGPREVERICALAEGKPYFAEELVNSAVMAGGSTLNVTPLSIRAGVLARFERLGAAERELVLSASVIGRNFDAALLARITGTSTSHVARSLTRARDLQLVREIDERPGAFIFRHAITREILYRELLAFQAQAVHRDIASELEKSTDANTFDLAFHWSAGGDRQRASEAFERTGDDAFSRGAHRDAEAAFRAAFESRDAEAPTYATLCEKLSRALSINGDVDQACTLAERALEGHVAAGKTAEAATLAIRLARRIYESGRPAAAAITATRALDLSGNRGAVAYDACVTIAHFEALQGNNDSATAFLARAEAIPGEHPATPRRNAHLVTALVAASSGRLREAFEHYEAAVALARELDDAEQLAWTLNNYASRAMATGWMQRALATYGEAARVLRLDEFGKVAASTVQGLAFAELLGGNLPAVRAHQAQDSRLPSGIAMTQTARTALAVRLAFYACNDEEAATLATPEAVELAFNSGETQRIGLLAGCVAAWYDAIGKRSEAAALRTRALATVRTVDFSFWLLDQVAAHGDDAGRMRARNLLAEAAADPDHLAAAAHVDLFDARVAQSKRATSAKMLAGEAAAKFERIGWPWERAQALEIAGRHADALELYRRHGFVRQERALTRSRRRARHRAATFDLTARELEVARLAAQGKSNRAIAGELFIGERTVETHIAAIFDRFDLTSRRQLGDLLKNYEQVETGLLS